jgi:hypothetical protein
VLPRPSNCRLLENGQVAFEIEVDDRAIHARITVEAVHHLSAASNYRGIGGALATVERDEAGEIASAVAARMLGGEPGDADSAILLSTADFLWLEVDADR